MLNQETKANKLIEDTNKKQECLVRARERHDKVN
jgi:hypothetical protein